MSNHSFNPLLAKKYGIIESIFIDSFIFWTSTNAAKGENFFESRYWVYGTPEYFTKYYTYLTSRQIKYALSNLCKKGIFIKNNFNKKGYDKTNWYALSDTILSELNLDKCCLKPAPVLIGQNCPIDRTKLSDALDKIVLPIPDTKPDTKQDIKHNPIDSAHESAHMCTSESAHENAHMCTSDKIAHVCISDNFEQFWKVYPVKKNKVRAQKLWKRDKLDPLLDLICADILLRIEKEPQWQDKNFIPHPSTYLHGKLWTDEITQTQLPKEKTGDAYSRAMEQIRSDINSKGRTYEHESHAY